MDGGRSGGGTGRREEVEGRGRVNLGKGTLGSGLLRFVILGAIFGKREALSPVTFGVLDG